ADLSHIPSLKGHRAILHGDRHLILNLANLPSGDAAKLWRFVEAGLVEDGLLKTRRAFTEAGHEVPKWLESIDTLRDALAHISKDYTDTTDAWRGPRVTTETEAGRDSLFEYVGFDWFLEESLRLRDGDVDLDVRGVPFRNELFAGLPPELESLDFLPGSIPDWENKRIYINSNDSQLTRQKPIARIVRRLFGE
ncbi:MAG: hypothetical protein KC417_17655, partial [Myxococcales bacterium]|nr:hypothetical protein [Myxococcales bacterium]